MDKSESVFVITGGRIVTLDQEIKDGVVEVTNGRISMVGSKNELNYSPDAKTIDVSGLLVIPGLIDLQVNGLLGLDWVLDPSPEVVLEVADGLCQYGVTAFLPTVYSATDDRTRLVLRVINEAMSRQESGARILGINFEGPYLCPSLTRGRTGASLRAPDVEEFVEYVELAQGKLRMITIAPELPGAIDLIHKAVELDVVVSIGHTEASFEQAEEAIAAGAIAVTHMFNAFRPFHHRDPGVLVAVMIDDSVCCQVISDGKHVSPATLQLLFQCKGTDNIVITSDICGPAGCPDGIYQFADTELQVCNGKSVLVQNGEPTDLICGSVLPMNGQVARARNFLGLDFPTTVRLGASNPARLIGYDSEKGSLEVGKDGDLVVCTEEFDVVLTMIKGEIMYKAEGIAIS